MASEADWERIALERLAEPLGWEPQPGQEIAPGTTASASSWEDLLLPVPLLAALQRLNPIVPARTCSRRWPRSSRRKSQDAIAENYRHARILVDGYRGISYIDSDGIEQNPTIRLREPPGRGQRLARGQPGHRPVAGAMQRRFDVVLYSTACRWSSSS